MTPITHEDSTEYPIAILCKEMALDKTSILRHYVEPLMALGVGLGEVISFPLDYGTNDKAPIKVIRSHVKALLPNLVANGVQYVLVNDGAYFKELTGEKQTEVHLGYVLPCKYEGYQDLHIILGVNYKSFYFNPDNVHKLNAGIEALVSHVQGTYVEPGESALTDLQCVYRHDPAEKVDEAFAFLMLQPSLELDIEAFSLKFYKAGLGTFSFSYDNHAAIAFQCDYKENTEQSIAAQISAGGKKSVLYGEQKDNPWLKEKLKNFLIEYKGKVTYHNGSYDIKVLIFELFMSHAQDYRGMLEGIKFLTKNIDDTKLIAYLALNSCSRTVLKLKVLAHEFTGNYAQEEINDIRRIPLNQLLKYNAIDCIATRWVKQKYLPKMIADQQLCVYDNIFKPSIAVLLQAELVGMPLDMDEVLNVKEELSTIESNLLACLATRPKIVEFIRVSRNTALIEKNLQLVRTQHTIDQYSHIVFNPNSNPQMSKFLYEECGLPVIDKTKSGQPSVGGKTLKKLLHQTSEPEVIEILETLIAFAEVSIILSTFVTAFVENSVKKADGVYWLHGSFNLGGTVSGRLSSSQPNLQNIPSTGSTYAKHIKRCFKAPPGWLYVGVDFASLEDRVSALTTKDPQKLKVYTDGYDGHCLRAYAYFPHRMPDIVEQMSAAQDDPEVQVKIINSIADLYEDVRQDSKPPTFLLTYQGTWMGLMLNVGMTEEDAKSTEANFHKLYAASGVWVQNKLVEASKVGYVTVAFGLRVRTPMLSKTVMSATSSIPYEAKKEGRTAGNALGQSYGMLNNRAAIEFQAYTLASPYKYDIMPSAHIHDAQYFVIRDDIKVVEWFNKTLIPCMQWQELPELQHPTVKLGGDLEIYHPNWASKIAIPNNATTQEIMDICNSV